MWILGFFSYFFSYISAKYSNINMKLEICIFLLESLDDKILRPKISEHLLPAYRP